MSDYRLKNGSPTTADDPQREVWYPASIKCGYWTDDWSKLNTYKGLRVCPECGCVGMQITAKKWIAVPREFLKGHPRYDEWLVHCKEQCGRKSGMDFMSRYRRWMEGHKEWTNGNPSGGGASRSSDG